MIDRALSKLRGNCQTRRASSIDWPVVARGYALHLQEENGVDLCEHELAECGRYIKALMSTPRNAVFILCDGEKRIGQVLCSEVDAELGKRVLLVFGLYITPESRGTGVTALIETCVSEAQVRGVESCEFCLNPANDTGFYSHIGCKLVGHLYRLEVNNVHDI